MDQSIDIFPIRIRLLQETHQPGHLALVNWGVWSRDRYWSGPVDARPSIWDEFKRDENEAYGEINPDETVIVPQTEIKQERAEDPPFNEKEGAALDDRLNAAGRMLDGEVRRVLRVVYVYRAIHEAQYCREVGCPPDAFCERLETGLKFAQRFA